MGDAKGFCCFVCWTTRSFTWGPLLRAEHSCSGCAQGCFSGRSTSDAMLREFCGLPFAQKKEEEETLRGRAQGNVVRRDSRNRDGRCRRRRRRSSQRSIVPPADLDGAFAGFSSGRSRVSAGRRGYRPRWRGRRLPGKPERWRWKRQIFPSSRSLLVAVALKGDSLCKRQFSFAQAFRSHRHDADQLQWRRPPGPPLDAHFRGPGIQRILQQFLTTGGGGTLHHFAGGDTCWSNGRGRGNARRMRDNGKGNPTITRGPAELAHHDASPAGSLRAGKKRRRRNSGPRKK